jgi:hypothetical protein
MSRLQNIKSGLYDASHHKAHNFNGKFCKFCAHEFEMIGFILLGKSTKVSHNLNQNRRQYF